jgi:phosphofructokinase-like protein
MTHIQRVAINTCGGDAPGLNAVLSAATWAAVRNGWEILGIRRGYLGLFQETVNGQPGLMPLTERAVNGISSRGGTILGTTTRGEPFGIPRDAVVAWGDGVSLAQTIVDRFAELEIDALITIGGDGSLSSANQLHLRGLPVVGVPKTIDNDLRGTDITFGFRTAVEVATEAIGRMHSTAEAHQRVIVVEVMGRHAGWIALNAGLGGGADVILIPEIPFSIDSIVRKVRERERDGHQYSVVVAAEGARPADGGPSFQAGSGRYGGIAERVARELEDRTGKESRSLVLGHLLRGGEPLGFDRVLALQLGTAAVQLVRDGGYGKMVGVQGQTIEGVPLADVAAGIRRVPLDHRAVATARTLGISFGD